MSSKGLFGAAAGPCSGAGMAKPGPLAIGGAKLKARASADANRRYAYLRDEYEEAARAY